MDKIYNNKRNFDERFNFEKNIDFRGLDEEYKKVVIKLGNDLKGALNFIEREKIFYDFIKKYAAIPSVCQNMIYYFAEEIQDPAKILKISLQQFYDRKLFEIARNNIKKWNSLKTILPFCKCYDYNMIGYVSDEILKCPNIILEKTMKNYDEKSDRPLSREISNKYEKAVVLSKRLSKLNIFRDFSEYIKICFEWDDKKFAYQSIEYQLSENYKTKGFWKAYINCVKRQNKKIMLNIYKRYTGLFLEDKEMKKEYKNEKFKAMTYPEFENLRDLQYYLFDEYSNSLENIQNVFENGKNQTFSLPKTIMFYILNSSSAKARFKLFESCKLFYIQKPTPICHKLEIGAVGAHTQYRQQSLKFTGTRLDFEAMENLYISNKLDFRYPNLQMLSIVISKIHKCEARFIDIWQQVISLNDLEFLASSKLEKFGFFNGGITNSNKNVVASVEDILKPLGSAHEIHIHANQRYEFSSHFSLSNLKRKTNKKLKKFHLGFFKSLLNLEDYCDFILKNADSSDETASFSLAFSNNVSDNDAAEFDKAVNEFTMAKFNKKFHRESLTEYYWIYKSENLNIFPTRFNN